MIPLFLLIFRELDKNLFKCALGNAVVKDAEGFLLSLELPEDLTQIDVTTHLQPEVSSMRLIHRCSRH